MCGYGIRSTKLSRAARRRRPTAGQALIAVLAVVGALVIQGASLGLLTINEFRAMERHATLLQSLHASEGGVHRALAELRRDPYWVGVTQALVGLAGHRYDITVTHLPTDPPNRQRVVATGYVPIRQRWQPYQVGAALDVVPHAVFFPMGIFARTRMEIAGNAVLDSYDSQQGAYGTGPIGNDADIGTNSVAADAIEGGGNAVINGDIIVGPRGNPQTVIDLSQSVQHNGRVLVAPEAAALPVVDVPDDLVNGGAFVLNGQQTQTLAAGSYWFSSFTTGGQATLQTDGVVTIYVTGAVDVGASTIAADPGNPAAFRMFVVGQQLVRVGAGATFYGTIYAPQSAVEIAGGSQFFGAVIGDTVFLKGSGNTTRFHYDIALRDMAIESGGATVQLLAWKNSGPLPPIELPVDP